MKRRILACLVGLLPLMALAQRTQQKPDVPVDKWAEKTIMLIGAHAAGVTHI